MIILLILLISLHIGIVITAFVENKPDKKEKYKTYER